MFRAVYKKHITIFRQLSRTDLKASFPKTSEMYQIFITIFKFSFTYSDSQIKHQFGWCITFARVETSYGHGDCKVGILASSQGGPK